MIVNISGQLVEKKDNAVVIDVNGLAHEVLIPASVMARVDEFSGPDGMLALKTYHYIQISPSKGVPCLIGFFNEIEREFFLDFIKVSGIGPRAAVKALNQPISQIAGAIARGDEKFLKGLPGIGLQKAKEVVAKLQGKVGKYGLIQDKAQNIPQGGGAEASEDDMPEWQREALDVLLQLQYKPVEARQMIAKALGRAPGIAAAEDLLNEIYKQRMNA